MKKKIFKNLDEQIEILKSKGLTINNEEYAKNILLRENYFFLNGYRIVFLKDEKTFIKGTTFDELYSLFKFDRVLRNSIFKYILVIENNIKSIISYQLSRKYGYKESDYLKAKNFDTSRDKVNQVSDLLKKMKRQVRINGDQHAATRHYIYNYGYIPMWVLVKVLSFGIVGELYAILKLEDRVEIANIYNLDIEELTIYLPLLANYRNICAHEDIVFENRTQRNIPDTKYLELLKVKKNSEGEYVCGKNDLFSLLIMIKKLVRKEELRELIKEIKGHINNLQQNINSIKIDAVLDRMGFPSNWEEIENLEDNYG